MSYQPSDTYLPSAHGGAQVPQLVGQRVEAARSYGASAGWSVHERPVAAPKGCPAGFVVRQEPAAGSIAPMGAVLLVDVARRSRGDAEWSRAMLGGIATAAAVAAGVFASLWLSERQDHDGTRAELESARADLDDLAAVPDWVGGPPEVVAVDAREHGWVVVPQIADPDEVDPATPAGVVLRQLPEPGTPLPDGAVVVIVVTEP
jgi:beta-lactam-binding protein with PASTA domain